ncbi:DUF6302 family protein [Streptomyces griseosporeus]|uniref:DUF6302 family protein n=1 Tax=Streptomyces griseosporeus TaxID=1910 RepID=UPI00379116F3
MTSPLKVSLLPPTDAMDYEYMRARLEDPSVLAQSVAVQVFRLPLIAVAVGGPRLGGYLSVDPVAVAMAIRDLLTGRPCFPDVRVSWSPYLDSCHVVEWGGPPPLHNDAERGRFYGYSAEAISKYLDSRVTTTSSSALLPRSPAAPWQPRRA